MSLSGAQVTRLGLSGSSRSVYGSFSGKSVSRPVFSRLGLYGGTRSLYGDFTGKVASPPVFAGTIPDITGTEGDSNVITDLSTYFTGATSYSIAPGVEAGWNFDTVTGILTVDTDEVNSFGPYVVTGTNISGSDDSNGFSVIISEASAVEDSNTGGWFWFKYEQEQLRKKEARRQQKAKREEAEKIEDSIEQEIALAERKLEEEALRVAELKTLTTLVAQFEEEIEQITTEKMAYIAKDAVKRYTYSSMERMERELSKFKEEEEFILIATQILFNQ